MTENNKTREEFVAEIKFLQQRIAELEAAVSKNKPSTDDGGATFKDVVITVPAGLAITSSRVVEWTNDYLLALVGRQKEEVLGKDSRIFYDSDERYQEVGSKFYAELRAKGKAGMETAFRHKDGRILNIYLTGAPLDRKDISSKIIFCALDITESKKAERLLQESQQHFQAIFDSTLYFTGLMTPEGFLVEANQTALGFIEAKIENVINRPFWETPWWRGDERRVAQLKDAIKRVSQGESLRYEVELSGAKDKKGIFEFSLRPIFDLSGKVIFVVPEARDITKRKKAEEALVESEKRYRILFEQSSDAMFIADPETKKIIDCNEAALRLTGYSREEMLLMYADQLHPKDTVAEAMEAFRRLITGNSIPEETQVQTKAGQRIEVSINGTVVELQGKSCIVGIFRDITYHKKAEEALRESGRKFSSLFESMNEMVVLHELVLGEQGEAVNYRILDCNNVFTKITGIKKEDAIGKLATDVYRAETAPFLKEYSRVAITGESCEFTTYFLPMNKHFSITVVSPKQHQFATITMDVTERKKAEEEKSKYLHELEVFYKASLGREERVIELKKKIDALKEELEKCKKNAST